MHCRSLSCCGSIFRRPPLRASPTRRRARRARARRAPAGTPVRKRKRIVVGRGRGGPLASPPPEPAPSWAGTTRHPGGELSARRANFASNAASVITRGSRRGNRRGAAAPGGNASAFAPRSRLFSVTPAPSNSARDMPNLASNSASVITRWPGQDAEPPAPSTGRPASSAPAPSPRRPHRRRAPGDPRPAPIRSRRRTRWA